MAQEHGSLPSIGDLLRHTQETKRKVDEFVKNATDREQKMILIMDELEKVNENGAPRLYVTVGKEEDRLVLSTIPILDFDEQSPKEDISFAATYPEVKMIKKTVYETEVLFLGVTTTGFYMLNIFGHTTSLDEAQMKRIQNPFLMPEENRSSTLTDFQLNLREYFNSAGRLYDASIEYDTQDGLIIPILSFESYWKELGKIMEKPFSLENIDPNAGIEMHLEIQEIYRNAIDARNEENRSTANVATRLIRTLKEKRKRGNNKN